jgi:hypothetical protein
MGAQALSGPPDITKKEHIMNKLFARTLLATSLALAAPVAAQAADANASLALTPAAPTAASQANPIRISGTEVVKAWDDHAKGSFAGMMNVTFTNTNPVTATEIVFVLREPGGRVIDQFKDVGKYPQGQTITHGFFDLQMTRQLEIKAEKATFADGSVWASSEETQPVSRRQASGE